MVNGVAVGHEQQDVDVEANQPEPSRRPDTQSHQIEACQQQRCCEHQQISKARHVEQVHPADHHHQQGHHQGECFARRHKQRDLAQHQLRQGAKRHHDHHLGEREHPVGLIHQGLIGNAGADVFLQQAPVGSQINADQGEQDQHWSPGGQGQPAEKEGHQSFRLMASNGQTAMHCSQTTQRR